jgi:hypothetical protein
MIPLAINIRMPMIPTNGIGSGAGLLEKRVLATSSLALMGSATQYGDKNKSLWDAMNLLDLADAHNNHGEDPATDTLALSDSATLTMEMLRPVESAMALTDYAHASLDGYHPPGSGNGSGDPDLSLHEVTANETVLVGQPVYISGNNTINLANAADLTESKAVGLVQVGATANGTANILTEGSVNQADWTNVIGSTNLTPGAAYFLGTTAGTMSTAPPTTDNHVVVTMGTAVTTTEFDIEVNEVAIL